MEEILYIFLGGVCLAGIILGAAYTQLWVLITLEKNKDSKHI